MFMKSLDYLVIQRTLKKLLKHLLFVFESDMWWQQHICNISCSRWIRRRPWESELWCRSWCRPQTLTYTRELKERENGSLRCITSTTLFSWKSHTLGFSTPHVSCYCTRRNGSVPSALHSVCDIVIASVERSFMSFSCDAVKHPEQGANVNNRTDWTGCVRHRPENKPREVP